MGLVFFGKQPTKEGMIVHNHDKDHQSIIRRLTVSQKTSNSKSVKSLTAENLMFLHSIGLFNNKG